MTRDPNAGLSIHRIRDVVSLAEGATHGRLLDRGSGPVATAGDRQKWGRLESIATSASSGRELEATHRSTREKINWLFTIKRWLYRRHATFMKFAILSKMT